MSVAFRRFPLLALGVLLALLVMRSSLPAHAALEIVVTSAAEGAGECPHESNCTLRSAIEAANADTSPDPVDITFDPAVFDTGDPQTIALVTPLPAVTRADITIDGTGGGVRLDGLALEGVNDGLLLAGDRDAVRGLAVHNFGGICIALAGASSQASANRVGGCGTGIYANATGATIRGNVVGFAPDSDDPSATTFGVVVNAAGVEVGDPTAGPATANIIGNAGTAVRVGDALGPQFVGIVVARNIIGKSPTANLPAVVGTGIEVRPPAAGTDVLDNNIANVSGSAVVVAGDVGDLATTGNRILGNRFEAIGAMSIDLGADGIREQNDPGDADTGPNNLLNHPVVTRAVQSRLEGIACPGCAVQLYLAAHSPGAGDDYGTVPLAGATLTADGGGNWSLDAPPLTPGQWILAIAVDGDGNTSEFSPSARVGAGVVQCGNIALGTGWNLVGFFGDASLPLGAVFPPQYAPASPVSAIYRLIDGTLEYQAWFAASGPGRTLDSVSSGEAYWMHAVQPVALDGGFSLTLPLPVTLHAGWNEFVYIGASADLRDALSSISGKYTSVFRWSNSPGDGRWLSYYPAVPSWAEGLNEIQSCAAYSIFVNEDVTLSPLQP